MLRRPDSARFAPGAHSFPGGVLDAPDYDVASAAIHALPGGATVTALHERVQALPGFDVPDPTTTGALLVCAARELFEETGVLLVREEEGGLLPLDNEARWAGAREDLLAGSLQFGRLLSEENLTIAPDDLIYFSHWITPEVVADPLRYPLLPRGAATGADGDPLGGGDGGGGVDRRRVKGWRGTRVARWPMLHGADETPGAFRRVRLARCAARPRAHEVRAAGPADPWPDP